MFPPTTLGHISVNAHTCSVCLYVCMCNHFCIPLCVCVSVFAYIVYMRDESVCVITSVFLCVCVFCVCL